MISDYAARLLRSLELFLLPNCCIACGKLVDRHPPHELVCSLCRWRMKPIIGGCRRCSQPLPPVGPCRFCAPWPPELLWARSAVWLDREAKAVVHHLKYRGYWALADFAAATIARYISRPQPGILVPVPLTRAKERRREYNQAALIARSLGSRWGLPVDETRLVRVRDGGSQTALTPEARLENIKDAFRARSAKAENFIIIVDDVLTTGATLNAAASALVTAGFSRLGAVTFARTSPFERRI